MAQYLHDMKTTTCKRNHKSCKPYEFCTVEIDRLVPQWTRLFRLLKSDIHDDYRCSDDSDDTTPGFQVTIGFTPSTDDKAFSWHYQTGDNSYTGGAYGHAHWAVIDLRRRSNSRDLANDCADQIAESVSQLS